MQSDVNGPGDPDNRTNLNAEAADGSSGNGVDWAAGLSEDNRAVIESKKWADPNAVLDGYRNADKFARDLQSKVDEALIVPGDDASPEDVDKFYSRLGKPETPDGYEFALPDGVPDEFPYDAESANKFKAWSHDAGLTPKQAQSLHDGYVKDMAGQFESTGVAMIEKEEAAHKDLVSAWGKADSPEYKRSVALAERAASRTGMKDALIEAGLLSNDGHVRDARVATALAKIGSELYAEDSLYSGPTSSGQNPFSRDNPNYSEQSALIRAAKADPSKAGHVKSLIQAAGGDPDKYL